MAEDLSLGDRIVGADRPVFVIAEIGQNHQGDIEIAKKLIEIAKISGADCAKFQKTCLAEKFNAAALRRKYDSENSWGGTYGEHKQYLEFTNEQFTELKSYADKIGILFSASAMDSVSLDFLVELGVPFVKIGSGDANNLLLIEKAAKKRVPLIVSTGMQRFETVQKIHETISKHHTEFVLMHCVSSYPTPVGDLNFAAINLYRETFADVHVGYSGHEMGYDLVPMAVALGAKVIERHITLDHNQKGSDHKCSLSPSEFSEMVRLIRKSESALGAPIKEVQQSEKVCYEKLGKTLVAARDLKAGRELRDGDFKVKVAEPKGIDGARSSDVVGSKLLVDLAADASLLEEYLK